MLKSKNRYVICEQARMVKNRIEDSWGKKLSRSGHKHISYRQLNSSRLFLVFRINNKFDFERCIQPLNHKNKTGEKHKEKHNFENTNLNNSRGFSVPDTNFNCTPCIPFVTSCAIFVQRYCRKQRSICMQRKIMFLVLIHMPDATRDV